MTYETILVEQRGAVTLVTLNRPQALNALNSTVLKELIAAFAAYDADDSQHCLVLTGSEKAFAAGADIKEMQSQGFADMYGSNFFAGWEQVTATRKPWIAAVAGFALGGGCEVAMMADFIIAADTAKFGQPEIKLGVTPGMGGSQRLTLAVGKAKAMEMCLTGRMMGAEVLRRFSEQRATIFAPVTGSSGRAVTEPSLDEVQQRGRDYFATLPSPIPDSGLGYFRVDLRTGAMDARGAIGGQFAVTLVDTVRKLAHAAPAASTPNIVVITNDGAPTSVAYAPLLDRTGKPTFDADFDYVTDLGLDRLQQHVL